jgi:hypothetical protein
LEVQLLETHLTLLAQVVVAVVAVLLLILTLLEVQVHQAPRQMVAVELLFMRQGK